MLDLKEFGVLVYKYVDDDFEHKEEYDDYYDMRSDYYHMTENIPDDFEYVIMQEVNIDDNGLEHIEVLEEYHK